MGRRQALGWLGAALCSVALIVAGGLLLSTVAVHRYLQASSSALHRGEAQDVGPTPAPGELATIGRVVTSLTAMPGVATASCNVDTASSSTSEPDPTPSSTVAAANAFSYDISVIMTPDATAEQSSDVVYNLTQELQNSRVNLELSVPSGDGHAESVVDYRNAFDAPVARSTVESVSQAVAVASAVPGIASVHVTVPYTWNLAAGDLDVAFADGAQRPTQELETALSGTALSGIEWSTSH